MFEVLLVSPLSTCWLRNHQSSDSRIFFHRGIVGKKEVSLTSSSIQAIEFNSSFGMSCMSSNNNSQKKKNGESIEMDGEFPCIHLHHWFGKLRLTSLCAGAEQKWPGHHVQVPVNFCFLHQPDEAEPCCPVAPINWFSRTKWAFKATPRSPLQKPLTGKVRCGEFSMVSPKKV